jgi:hypothetical protein
MSVWLSYSCKWSAVSVPHLLQAVHISISMLQTQ